MMNISINGSSLDVPSGLRMEVEETSPVFNDRGTQSLPATLPMTPRNALALGFPDRPESDTAAALRLPRAEVRAGAFMRSGVANVTEASEEGITLNVGFDNSEAYARWQGLRLAELDGWPEVKYDGVAALVAAMRSVMASNDPGQPLAVFPVVVARGSVKKAADSELEVTVCEVLNDCDAASGSLVSPTVVERALGDVVTQVTVPEGYGVTPFLRVWYILDRVFAHLGLSPQYGAFRSDPDFRRLVALNNVADACCVPVLRYADLLPDCTVEEFLNALWVRFGLVYELDFDHGTARVDLLRDILDRPAREIKGFAAGRGKAVFGDRRYLRLSAATSLEGAAPVTERFEDLARGLDLRWMPQGSDVNEWDVADPDPDHREDVRWDGDESYSGQEYDPDVYDPDWPEPDEPDQPEPDDPDPDYAARSRSAAKAAGEENRVACTLAREYVTGRFYRLDSLNRNVGEASSPFFSWDPRPEGLEPLELSSADECVPVMGVDASVRGASFTGLAPHYLTGPRHLHTCIVTDADVEKETGSTPLAFVLGFEDGGTTLGRVTPEIKGGRVMVYSDGTYARMSLLFQFADGLFAQYWRRYDEILRHSARSLEVTLRVPPLALNDRRMTLPVLFGGVLCLPDSASWHIPPEGDRAAVDLTLRVMQCFGDYDIDAEQGVPPFGAGGRRYVWCKLRDDSLKTARGGEDALRIALSVFLRESGYEDHADGEKEYKVDADSMQLVAVVRRDTVAEHPELPEPGPEDITATFLLDAEYDVYERWRPVGGNVWLRGELLRRVTVRRLIGYTQWLTARWAYV